MTKLNNLLLTLLVISFVFTGNLVQQYGLSLEDLIFDYYSENLVEGKLEQIIKNHKKWSWFGYILIPLFILLRSLLVSICLGVGSFFYDIENNIKFKEIFRVALFGEFILGSAGYFKFVYFYFFVKTYTFNDIQEYYPLSFFNLLNTENIDSWMFYPLQIVNLFEVFYFFVLVYGLHKVLKNNYWKSFEITATSYGIGLLIWIGLVMFLTLNFS
jgi:hypothetical protein